MERWREFTDKAIAIRQTRCEIEVDLMSLSHRPGAPRFQDLVPGYDAAAAPLVRALASRCISGPLAVVNRQVQELK